MKNHMQLYFGIALLVTSILNSAHAQLYKCTKSDSKITYQSTPCATNENESTLAIQTQKFDKIEKNDTDPLTSSIELEDASIVQIESTRSGFVYFELRARWVNNNSKPITIYYKTYFYDYAGIELYVDSRYKEMDASKSSLAPQVLQTFHGDGRDKFDYKKVRSIEIRYKLKEDNTVRTKKDVPLKKSKAYS